MKILTGTSGVKGSQVAEVDQRVRKVGFIAISYTEQRDGISIYLENLLLHLCRDAVGESPALEIDVFVLKSSAALLRRILEDHLGAGANVANIQYITVADHKVWRYFDVSYRLRRRGPYGLVVLPNPQPIMVGGKERTLTVFHDFTYREAPSYFRGRRILYNECLTRMRLSLDENIGYISDTTHEQMVRYYPRSRRRTRLSMPNGIPEKVLRRSPDVAPGIDAKFKAADIELLFVGRINRLKGFDSLRAICNSLDAQGNKQHRFVLHIVGKDTDESKALLSEMQFTNIEVNRHGYISDETLNELYRRSAFCFFLSRNEGFGLPAIEAAWLGCIPILSDIPIFREIMSESYPLFSLREANVHEDAAAFIIRVLLDGKYRKRIFELLDKMLVERRDGYRKASTAVLTALG